MLQVHRSPDRVVSRLTPALSPQHDRRLVEQSGSPVVRLLQDLKDDPARLAKFRHESDDIASQYFDRNVTPQDFLRTRATNVSRQSGHRRLATLSPFTAEGSPSGWRRASAAGPPRRWASG